MLTTRFASSVPQPFANDSAGFDYFSTDFHYMNVAAEIRRQLLQQRGFVLLNGPPPPDGKLLERYLDGSAAADAAEAAQFRANLVRCREGWTFGDVVIAYSRELGLSPDAGAWSILSQVMQESRKGLTRVLILDNAEALDDVGFDELRRFTRVDDPYILPVVLLAGPGFAERLELGSVKPLVVGALPLQHLMPAEVAAFIRYQVEPIGESAEEAFTPGAVATLAEAAEGDPRVVNQLARQHLDAFAGPRAPVAPVEAQLEHENLPVATDRIPAAAEVFSPRAEALPEPAFARSTGSAAVVEIAPLSRPRRRAERLARNLTVAAALLFIGVYGIAFLYSLVPESSSDGAAQPAAPVAAAAALPPPAQTANRPPAQPPVAPEKRVVSAEPRQPAAPQDAARSLTAAAKQAAGIEPSAAAPQTAAPAVVAAAPPADVAHPEPAPPPQTVARAEPAAAPPAAAPAPPAPLTVARAEPAAPAAPPPAVAGAEAAAPPPAAQPKPVTRAELQPAPRSAQAAEPPPAPASGMTALVERGDRLLAAGDIASAREFFERAVESGDAAASYGLGKSYDPLFLQQIAQQGVAGDATKAAAWYRRAAASGNAEAAKRLTQLLAKYLPGTAGQGSSR
jgi:TPR repeat protein